MEKTKLGFIRFFTGYFKYFPKLVLTNILFAIPAALFITIFRFINEISGLKIALIDFIAIIFIFPFWAGVTIITRNIAREDNDISVVKLFFKGIKDNLVRFIVHGFVYYAAIFLCYFSIVMYISLAMKQAFFFLPFGIAILITIAVMFISYNVPTMTVTFDLKMGQIYRNSFLMSFGEIKNNLLATIGLFLLTLIAVSIYLVIPGLWLRNIVLIAMFALFIPSTASYIINFYVFKDMVKVITLEETTPQKAESAEKKEEEKAAKDFSQLDLGEDKDDEEYLFFGGKMVKRKTLRKMRDAQEAAENNE